VTYFQVPWASKHGALQTFGCEAAVVAGIFLIIVPALQVKGGYFRVSYSFVVDLCFAYLGTTAPVLYLRILYIPLLE
jgi:hypothetical protein